MTTRGQGKDVAMVVADVGYEPWGNRLRELSLQPTSPDTRVARLKHSAAPTLPDPMQFVKLNQFPPFSGNNFICQSFAITLADKSVVYQFANHQTD